MKKNTEAVDALAAKGAQGASSIPELVGKLDSPRIVWIMVPSGKPVDDVIEELLGLLEPGDIIIDGGNSNYRDTMRRSTLIEKSRIHMIDSGTSGGIWGLKEGYSMMVGGETEVVESVKPIFETLAPAKDRGWGHVGPSGAGHYVKKAHNNIGVVPLEDANRLDAAFRAKNQNSVIHLLYFCAIMVPGQ